jgi:hypothetical protein
MLKRIMEVLSKLLEIIRETDDDEKNYSKYSKGYIKYKKI